MQVLQPFPYYGAKNRMAPMIAELIDFANTDRYYEVFGGSGAVLLTKSRHQYEEYNDASAGLSTFFELMAKPSTARELIYRIEYTDFSEEIFREAKNYRDMIEDDFADRLNELSKQIYFVASVHDSRGLFSGSMCMEESIDRLKEKLNTRDEKDVKDLKRLDRLVSEWKPLYNRFVELYQSELYGEIEDWILTLPYMVKRNRAKQKANFDPAKSVKDERDSAYDKAQKQFENPVTDFDRYKMAVATYVVYTQSRDGMGIAFSKEKEKIFHNGKVKLYSVMERMQDVKVRRQRDFGYRFGKELAKRFGDNAYLDSDIFNRPKNMVYLDPPYLDMETNDLGKTYKQRTNRKHHESMLTHIAEAQAKLIVSNYDNGLYNKYLKPPRWKKIYYNTTTSIGGKKNNDRVEVLFCNY